MPVNTRCLSAFLLLLLGASICRAQEAQVKDTRPRKPVSGDPVIHFAASNPRPTLPAKARTGSGPAERTEERAHWAEARWTHATLQLPGTKEKTIAFPSAGTVFVRASWSGSAPVAVTVVKQGSTLATAKSAKRFDGSTVATAQAKVASPGQVVIRASGSGSAAVKVDLYVGALPGAD
jgi:hypothetical protein